MTIKDFKVGQTAYILEDRRGTPNETTFLYEDKDYGTKRLLFLTTKDVDEYNELNDLRSWVQEATNWMKVKDYTLAQLRAVKKILKGDNHGGVAQESDQGD